ncbi:hypothetical protein [uncultured Maricaulis sp.]|uniref:hypothetical protein n=1 Tax=uncultured Maricaulis sp. TaxID=174710 RepID=UPI0030DB569B
MNITTLQERVHGTPRPDGWMIGKLHQTLRVRRGNKNAGMQERNLLSLSFGRIKRKDINTADGLLPESFETYQVVERGDIVMRLTDLQNDKRSLRQGLVRERGIITSAYDALHVSDDDEPRFWAYALLALDLAKYYYSLGGGVRQSIKFTDFPNEWITRPDLNTQKAIAAFLDRETARIDQLIEKKQRLVALLGEKRQAVFDQVVMGREGGATALVPSGVDWFGSVPHDWTVCRFQRLISSKVDYRGRTPVKLDDGVFLVTGRNIKNGAIDYQRAAEYTSAAEWAKLQERGAPEIGDVLMTTEAPLGEIAQVDRCDVAFAQRIIKFQARADLISNDYLAAMMQTSEFQGSLSLYSSGSTAKGIKSERLAHLFGVVPPPAAQAEIVRHLRARMSAIDNLKTPLDTSIARLKEHRSALITAAVTGQIDVTRWSRHGEADRRLDQIQEELAG